MPEGWSVRTCPWWGHAGLSQTTSLFPMCPSRASKRMFYHLPRHRSDADRLVALFTILKNGFHICLFSTHPGHHLTAMNSQIPERGLATALANSFKTLGFTSPVPIDSSMFNFLRWSQTWPSLTAGVTCLLQMLPWVPSTWETWKERVPLKAETKSLLSTSIFSLSTVTGCVNTYFPDRFVFPW